MSNPTTRTFADYNIDIPWGVRGEYATLCPKCSHARSREHQRSKCLSVNVDEETWFCQHCGWSGGLTYGERGESKPEGVAYGAPLRRHEWERKQRPVEYAPAPEPPEKALLSEGALHYLGQRGFSTETVTALGLFTTRIFVPDLGREETVIAFPYYRGGVIVNYKYRTKSKAFTMVKGAERPVWNYDNAMAEVHKSGKLALVEGEMDGIAIIEAGMPGVVSVPNGANIGAKALEYLDTCADLFAAAREVYIAVDSDEKGRALEAELARRIGKKRCYLVRWPEDCKDANDVLVKKAFRWMDVATDGVETEQVDYEAGRMALMDCLANAEAIPVDGLVRVHDIRDRILDLYRRGLPPGLSMGWDFFDALYTVKDGEVTTVTGAPNSGKSTWLDCGLTNLAERHDFPTVIFGPENDPPERHIATLLAQHARQPFGTGPAPRMTEATLDKTMDWVNEYFTFITQPARADLDYLLELAEVAVFRYGVRGVVLDPWNRIAKGARRSNMTETQHVEETFPLLCNFARRHSVHLWLVAHPRKMGKKEDGTGNFEVATMYDIAGSAHFFDMTDNGLSVWRDYTGGPTRVYSQKIRFPEIGKIGSAEFAYHAPTRRFGRFTPGTNIMA